MTYEALFTLIAGLLPMIAAVVAIVNWMNAQFAKLSHRIESVQHLQSIKDTQLDGRLDNFELRINGNKELIEHRTLRFQDTDRDIHARITEEVRRLTLQIEQLRGYLEKHGFKPREID